MYELCVKEGKVENAIIGQNNSGGLAELANRDLRFVVRFSGMIDGFWAVKCQGKGASIPSPREVKEDGEAIIDHIFLAPEVLITDSSSPVAMSSACLIRCLQVRFAL